MVTLVAFYDIELPWENTDRAEALAVAAKALTPALA